MIGRFVEGLILMAGLIDIDVILRRQSGQKFAMRKSERSGDLPNLVANCGTADIDAKEAEILLGPAVAGMDTALQARCEGSESRAEDTSRLHLARQRRVNDLSGFRIQIWIRNMGGQLRRFYRVIEGQ